MSREPTTTFYLAPRENKARTLSRIVRHIEALGDAVGWEITIKRRVKKRSLDQNAYLWGVCYPAIMHGMLGLFENPDECHEFCLCEYFGSVEKDILGTRMVFPRRRSSKLTTLEFMDYVDYLQRYWATHNVLIPDPST